MNYFDCHADTLVNMPENQGTLGENQCNIDLKRARGFAEKYTQIFAIWNDFKVIEEGKVDESFLRLYDRAVSLMKAEEDQLVWCRTGEEMEQAHQMGKAAAFLSIEDLSLMGSYASEVRELGIRFAMLTWNYENQYACGSAANQKKGLTDEGRETVRMLINQGIVLDISHLSDAGAEEIFQMTDVPVIASHSNVREICNCPRNLRKDQIQELIRRKGLIGMNMFAPFVGENPTITDVLRHMDYILNLGGEDALVFGGDLDGSSNRFPQGFHGIESLPLIREAMEKAGFGSRLTDKIFFENARAFVRQNVR
ncbi:dipeptidase [Blautia sp. HCP3S3_G3]|uniref:dipeptidase n=1 Tax=Blautia sp. HCP3S3_G3 TaxID=3438913 RepID=UPI003F8BE92A